MEPLLHVSNALLLLSFAARDILWLRVLSAAACTCVLMWLFGQPGNPWGALAYWNLLFVGLNAFHIAWLLHERRPVHLSEEERRLHTLAFPGVSDRHLALLLTAAQWEEAYPGEDLVVRGQPMRELLVLVDGEAVVRTGSRTACLGPGAFLGEMSLLTDQPAATADVIAAGRIRYVSWPIPALERLLDLDPDLRMAVQQSLGVDLVRKLRAA